jgi:hypothetical protein
MKLHDNTVLTGVLVVLCTTVNLLKPKRLIEFPRGRVGHSHLQEQLSPDTFDQWLQECLRDTYAPVFGSYRNVEDFDLIFRDGASDEKSNDRSADLGDPYVVSHRVPLRRLRG